MSRLQHYVQNWSYMVRRLPRLQILARSFVECARLQSSSDEVEKAKQASQSPQKSTIFTKVINREIPADIIYEDEKCLAFRDVNPVAPVHILVIPREPISQLSLVEDRHQELLGHLLITAHKVAAQCKLTKGFRVVINDGHHGAQSVYHLHIHVIGGRQMTWPPG